MQRVNQLCIEVSRTTEPDVCLLFCWVARHHRPPHVNVFTFPSHAQRPRHTVFTQPMLTASKTEGRAMRPLPNCSTDHQVHGMCPGRSSAFAWR
jgi:hypothetical protein